MLPARRCSGSARFSIKHSSRHASAVAAASGPSSAVLTQPTSSDRASPAMRSRSSGCHRHRWPGVCPRVRMTCHWASPSGRIWLSWSCSSTVYGMTGWSRYSALQQRGAAAGYRVGVRDAGGDPGHPLACSIALPPTWSACQWVLTTSGSWPVRACTQSAVWPAWPAKPLVDQGRSPARQQEQVGGGNGRCCQVIHGGRRPGSSAMCSPAPA